MNYHSKLLTGLPVPVPFSSRSLARVHKFSLVTQGLWALEARGKES